MSSKNVGAATSALVLPPESIPQLGFTIEQASAYTGATVSALRHAVWQKKLTARLAGKRLLFLRADLDAWFVDQLPRVRSGPYFGRPAETKHRRAA